jgi:hypothetical protein
MAAPRQAPRAPGAPSWALTGWKGETRRCSLPCGTTSGTAGRRCSRPRTTSGSQRDLSTRRSSRPSPGHRWQEQPEAGDHASIEDLAKPCYVGCGPTALAYGPNQAATARQSASELCRLGKSNPECGDASRCSRTSGLTGKHACAARYRVSAACPACVFPLAACGCSANHARVR